MACCEVAEPASHGSKCGEFTRAFHRIGGEFPCGNPQKSELMLAPHASFLNPWFALNTSRGEHNPQYVIVCIRLCLTTYLITDRLWEIMRCSCFYSVPSTLDISAVVFALCHITDIPLVPQYYFTIYRSFVGLWYWWINFSALVPCQKLSPNYEAWRTCKSQKERKISERLHINSLLVMLQPTICHLLDVLNMPASSRWFYFHIHLHSMSAPN